MNIVLFVWFQKHIDSYEHDRYALNDTWNWSTDEIIHWVFNGSCYCSQCGSVNNGWKELIYSYISAIFVAFSMKYTCSVLEYNLIKRLYEWRHYLSYFYIAKVCNWWLKFLFIVIFGSFLEIWQLLWITATKQQLFLCVLSYNTSRSRTPYQRTLA